MDCKSSVRFQFYNFNFQLLAQPVFNFQFSTFNYKTCQTNFGKKNTQVDKRIERFTVGLDREMDLHLARHDVLGSMAHITMLAEVGLLGRDELTPAAGRAEAHLPRGRGGAIRDRGRRGGRAFAGGTAAHPPPGRPGQKKIHSGRSRNDQVLLDLKLFAREGLERTVQAVCRLFDTLVAQSERYRHVLMPGYTHLQVAMPSSFGLWFGAYAESLADDLQMLLAAWRVTNRNPLGSAAGYGSSFPLDRQLTTDLLGFDSMDYNVVYAQMGRGKMERTVATALASVAATVAKMAFDACLYTSQNFGFIRLPDEYTTGSSIMPHKKNPDVFELTRAKCNKLQALPQQITLITNNLPSGYFRDLQMTKELFVPAFDELIDCLDMAERMMAQVRVNEHILDDPRYDPMFSVEEVNRRTLAGTPLPRCLPAGGAGDRGRAVPPPSRKCATPTPAAWATCATTASRPTATPCSRSSPSTACTRRKGSC